MTTTENSKIAFLFPGQGSQAVGMGKDLYLNSIAAREVFDEIDDALGFKLSTLTFEGPEAVYYKHLTLPTTPYV